MFHFLGEEFEGLFEPPNKDPSHDRLGVGDGEDFVAAAAAAGGLGGVDVAGLGGGEYNDVGRGGGGGTEGISH